MKRLIIVLSVLVCPAFSKAQSFTLEAPTHKPLTGNQGFFLKPITADAYTKHLGFFCKQEISMDRKLAMPVRFRLGSIEQCNYLEQKTGYKNKVE